MNKPPLSPAGTGLRETYSFICSDSKFKAELTVSRTLCPEPEPDAFFCICEYACNAFCQPVIAKMYFLFYKDRRFYDGDLKGICLRLHGHICQECHA